MSTEKDHACHLSIIRIVAQYSDTLVILELHDTVRESLFLLEISYFVYYILPRQVGDSCPMKWNAMKEKRDQQYAAEVARETRAQTMQSIGRLVIKTEKYVQPAGTYDTCCHCYSMHIESQYLQ